MHANRRKQCEAWAANSLPAYCYRFNVHANDDPYIDGVQHFEEVSFVFYNTQNLGYHSGAPFSGVPASYYALSQMMTSMWASFIHDLDPNTGINNSDIHWAPYDHASPGNFVFDANVTSYMEADTWRKAGIDYINSIPLVYGR
jgi:cholinesterase